MVARLLGKAPWLPALPLLLAPATGQGEQTWPVFVTVQGEGPPVRVQVYTTACRAEPSHWPFLDRMVAVGQTVQGASPNRCICFRHTRGYFRQIDFGPVVGLCAYRRRPSNAYFDGAAFRLTVTADRPPNWRPEEGR